MSITETQHTGSFILNSILGALGHSPVTVLSGQDLNAGAVVGRVKYGIGRVSIPTAVGTGNGAMTNVFGGADVEVGSYVMTCTAAVTHGGVFSITTPSGKRLPDFTMTPGSGGATTYRSSHINFTLTDGTDFIVGDSFTFVVSTTVPTVIGGTGTGVLTAASLGPDAMPGNYRIINRAVVVNGGDFEVIAPNGTSVGRFLMGTGSAGTAAFASRQVNFTLSDATDYILGNYFDLCVFNQLAGGKAVAWDPTAVDGRQHVAGILYGAVDASLADAPGVVMDTPGVVRKAALSWGAAISAAEKETAYAGLRQLGIVARD